MGRDGVNPSRVCEKREGGCLSPRPVALRTPTDVEPRRVAVGLQQSVVEVVGRTGVGVVGRRPCQGPRRPPTRDPVAGSVHGGLGGQTRVTGGAGDGVDVAPVWSSGVRLRHRARCLGCPGRVTRPTFPCQGPGAAQSPTERRDRRRPTDGRLEGWSSERGVPVVIRTLLPTVRTETPPGRCQDGPPESVSVRSTPSVGIGILGPLVGLRVR